MLLLTIGLTQVCLIVFNGFALAALQNVTVDDAVLTGPMVPQYIPSTTPPWNQGADCSVCLVKPNPAHAYNGTWHDTTFFPGNGTYQSIELTFTGSAVYIFFILANNITGATTFTNVNFILDGAPVDTYVHNPSSSADYQYDVPVYSNSSMNSGEHTIIIEPVDSGAQVLILFDYLIYTVDTDQATTTSVSPSTSTNSGSSAPPTTSSSHDTGAIVGGTIGGLVALAIGVALLLYYWRRKGRHPSPVSLEEVDVVEPFISPVPIVQPVTFVPTSITETRSAPESSVSMSSTRSDPPSAPSSSTSPPSGPSPGGATALMEQVELLREEVAQLRHLRGQDGSDLDPPFIAPPQYSESE